MRKKRNRGPIEVGGLPAVRADMVHKKPFNKEFHSTIQFVTQCPMRFLFFSAHMRVIFPIVRHEVPYGSWLRVPLGKCRPSTSHTES